LISRLLPGNTSGFIVLYELEFFQVPNR